MEYTDEGIYGVGEVGLAYGVGGAAGAAMVRELAARIIGKDPFRTEAIWEDFSSTPSGDRAAAIYPAGQGGNGPMEGFWGILKSEMYYLRQFHTFEELKKAIDEYIDFYNTRRLQAKLKGLAPLAYRNQTLVA